MTSSPSPRPSFSLSDLLKRERSELHGAPPSAPSRERSRRHASSPPPSPPSRGEEEDAVAGTVVAVLSRYAGRLAKDAGLRRVLREKCAACLAPAAGAGHAVVSNLERCIESIERLADDAGPGAAPRDAKIRSLRSSIRLLSVVASLHAPPRAADDDDDAGEGFTCGVPNSHLAACAQLYLSIVYKMERNDAVSARHLLQVFADAPHLARENLLPDLWGHVFLPRLLHLEAWFSKESELVAALDAGGRSSRMKTLQRLYNDQLDAGTAQFAMYYKEWLKCGTDAPPAPAVPLPSIPVDLDKWEKHSASLLRKSSINVKLYNVVFGTSFEQEDVKNAKLSDEDESVPDPGVELDGNLCGLETLKPAHRNMGLQEKHFAVPTEGAISEAAPTPRKSYSFRLLSCRGDVSRNVITHSEAPKKEIAAAERELDVGELAMTLERAASAVSSSDSLAQCEYAVRKIGRACSDPRGDPDLAPCLSCPSFIQGLLEVTFSSKDDTVLESAILIMGELVLRNEVNRQIMLNSDPQLEVFLKLLTLRSNRLFLKAAVVLHLIKPRAKQMLSLDWMPLVLHILECGDELQLLHSVRCSPRVAAFYLLDQLLMGFDVDRNADNAKQMIALGGLDLLMSRLEAGDARETKSCISLLSSCIQADGGCRHYLADNLNKERVVELLLLRSQKNSAAADTLSFMSELLCLHRTSRVVSLLGELRSGGCLNTMHILLVYLHQAPLVEHPLAAAILLQLDLLGDPSQYSVYREEAVDAMTAALERSSESRKVQRQCARALLLLAGRFSSSGEPMAETWLLKRAGLDDSLPGSFRRRGAFKDKGAPGDDDGGEEEKAAEGRQKKLAVALLGSGRERFLAALSGRVASDGAPALARACLVTAAWMSSSLSPLTGCSAFQPLACSVLAPKLLESLSYDRALEDRVLASVSLLNIVRHPECLEKLLPVMRESMALLRDLAGVTWTAKELLFACCR